MVPYAAYTIYIFNNKHIEYILTIYTDCINEIWNNIIIVIQYVVNYFVKSRRLTTWFKTNIRTTISLNAHPQSSQRRPILEPTYS